MPSRSLGARLWLARHAEVHEDWRGRAYGDLDVPLSREGLGRTEVLADSLAGLRPAVVLSSPLERAHLLGRLVAERAGVPLEADPAWREIHRGRWQGRSVQDLHDDEAEAVGAFYRDPWAFDGHGGESDARLFARIVPALQRALDRHPRECLVVTTHYNVIRVLLARALGVPPTRSFALRVDPGHAVLLVDAPGGWSLRRSNVATPAPESSEIP